MKRRSLDFQSNGNLDSGSGGFQRQLQHLFNLHDSGLDQSFIDSLPVFLYKDLVGLNEPYDCPVCLCEFSEQDKLRLLPVCSHAFHIDCIDTWLLSNSTCPLCRGMLLTEGFSLENPVFEFDDSRNEEGFSGNVMFGIPSGPKPAETGSIMSQKRVLSVRLGKFRNIKESGRNEDIEFGEASNSNLDARRCFSMGSYQYVVADTELQVALCPDHAKFKDCTVRERHEQKANPLIDGDGDGKKINMRSKGESFSVSKVWQWSSKKGKPANYRDNYISSSTNLNLSWSSRIQCSPR